jgi:predicted enzyme related to lactoylglutathione lyase
MERVTGIGGFFFRAYNPESLRRWYTEQLGVDPVPTSYEESPWWQEAGPTVFEAFSDGGGLIPDEKTWMVNLRVRDLDAMVEQLRRAGVGVEVDPEVYPNGRFAQLVDPEGNPIQLWEPTADALAPTTSDTQG